MRTVGIVCEYNPFHNGHKRQIDILRGMGYDCIVCVMSGNFTQRGELAMFDKYTRAKSAAMGGADLVLELPFPFCSMSAEGFAAAGVHILGSLGIENISFGSECADAELLTRAARAITSDAFIKKYADIQKNGPSGSTKAYFEALGDVLGENAALLSNDILAISYIAAINRSGYGMNIVPIKREGLGYNDTELCKNTLPSASAIRKALMCGDEDAIKHYVPKASATPLFETIGGGLAPVYRENIGRELHAFFKLITPDEICNRAISRSGGGTTVAHDGCGIADRLCNSARTANNFDSFTVGAYNAKYTDARIDRVILFSVLGVSDRMTHSLPEYTTILAANTKGRQLLSVLRKSCDFPIVTKPADAPFGIQTRLSSAADELYATAVPKNIDPDCFVKKKPFIM